MKWMYVGMVGAASMMMASAASAQIKITDFKEEHLGKTKVKLTIAAEATGSVKIGSYGVSLVGVKPPLAADVIPAGLSKDKNGLLYVFSTDFGKPGAFLKDNGQKDEDPRPGVFSITLDAARWPEGKYYLNIFAMNRPATGAYVQDKRAVVLTAGNPSDVDGTGSNVKDEKNVVIYHKEGIYACFPSLTKLDDGRLVTTFGTRIHASHIDGTGGTATMISSDGGDTWTLTKEKFINPIHKTKDGKLVIAGVDGFIEAPADQRQKLEAEQKIIMNVRPGTIAYLGGAFYKISDDGGKTWQKHAIEIPDDIAGLMSFHEASTHLVTRDGVRLVCVYGKRKGQKLDEVFFLRSTDDGQSWSFVEMLPDGLQGAKIGYNETAITQLPNGDILAMSRPQPDLSVGHLFRSVSHDDGLTWSKPEKTAIWGYPANLLVLPDGRILCVYGYRRPPMGIRATLSSDDGKTWDVKHEMILRADSIGSSSDIGYPLVTLRPDGKLFTIYYINTDAAMPQINGTIFSVPPK